VARLYGPACEEGRCYCKLARGVLKEDLQDDGPYNPITPSDKLRLDTPGETVYRGAEARP
jgi:hypothetical protein